MKDVGILLQYSSYLKCSNSTVFSLTVRISKNLKEIFWEKDGDYASKFWGAETPFLAISKQFFRLDLIFWRLLLFREMVSFFPIFLIKRYIDFFCCKPNRFLIYWSCSVISNQLFRIRYHRVWGLSSNRYQTLQLLTPSILKTRSALE